MSLATVVPTGFAGSTFSHAIRTQAVIRMQEDLPIPPVFSKVEGVEPPEDSEIFFSPNAFAQTLPGIAPPLGFWDPAGFCADANGADGAATEGKIRFYREVELKHCRVAMLAAVGFPLAEQWHPLFDVDTPSFSAFQQTPLQTFWPIVVFTIACFEVFSVFTFENPNIEGWAIRKDHVLGRLGNRVFDPLNLMPQDPTELREMQTKELNNGRLAMIAVAGMIVQEGVTGAKLF